MEARPATNEEAPPAARHPIPPPTNQVPNNCAERNRVRERRGQHCRKWMKVLNNGEKLAFRGWKDVPEPWTYEMCKQYIEWCHNEKAFNRDQYLAQRSIGRANLKFCENSDFLENCIQLY